MGIIWLALCGEQFLAFDFSKVGLLLGSVLGIQLINHFLGIMWITQVRQTRVPYLF